MPTRLFPIRALPLRAFASAATLACAVLLSASCSIGGKYGYEKQQTSGIPAGPVNLPNEAYPFLVNEFKPAGWVEPVEGATAYYAEYIVRGLQGYVVQGSNEWEKLQISFTLTGGPNPTVIVIVDGWLASGFAYPADSQFTENLATNHGAELGQFSRKLTSDFQNYLSKQVSG